MSGGVDSSVTAALLKEQGYDVSGVFIKVWHPDFLGFARGRKVPCDWREDRRDAMRVAALLDIPFHTFDLEKEYKKEVVDYMIREYRRGRVPNPDVMCNKSIKFGSFLERARALGADYVATGHYARVEGSKGKDGLKVMLEGVDKNKDQSYFLWTLSQKELSQVLFPVGDYSKPKIRSLARTFKLPTAEKKDSQGLCFMGKIDVKEFLKNYIKPRRGKVFNTVGEEIGWHDGAEFFAIGERHGFTINKKSNNDRPFYIVAKDIKKNTLTVSNKTAKRPESSVKKILIDQVNWVSGNLPNLSRRYSARLRYRQEKQPCRLFEKGGETVVIFSEAQEAVSAGQSLVIYDGEECLGGGIIKDVV